MIKKSILGFGVLLLLFSTIISCKKKDGNNDSTPATLSASEGEKAKSITIESSPRSDKKFGEFTANGEKVNEPEAFTAAETNTKLSILSPNNANARTAATGLKGWVLTRINSINNDTEKFWIFFKPDGKYLIYNHASKNWAWGFYYINQSLSLIAFDPESVYEGYWTVSTLSTTQFEIKTKVGLQYSLEPFTLENYEEQSLADNILLAKLEGKKLKVTTYKVDGLDTCEVINDITRVFEKNNVLNEFLYSDLTQPSSTLNWSIENGILNIDKNTYKIKYITENEISIVQFGAINDSENKKSVHRTVVRHNLLFRDIIAKKDNYNCGESSVETPYNPNESTSTNPNESTSTIPNESTSTNPY